jgi:hypothetical protein
MKNIASPQLSTAQLSFYFKSKKFKFQLFDEYTGELRDNRDQSYTSEHVTRDWLLFRRVSSK